MVLHRRVELPGWQPYFGITSCSALPYLCLQIPYFNAPIYLENKTQIGKVEEILGSVNNVVSCSRHAAKTAHSTGLVQLHQQSLTAAGVAPL